MDLEEIINDFKARKKYVFFESDLYNLNLTKKEVKELIKEGLERELIVSLPKNAYYLKEVLDKDIPFEILVDNIFEKRTYYLSLGYALRYWGFNADNIKTYVATRRKELNTVKWEIGEHKIEFRYLDQKFYFGVIRVPSNTYMVNVSDFEKTLLDAIVFMNEDTNLDVICDSLDTIKDKLNITKFTRYVTKTEHPNTIKRAGYILDRILGFDVGDKLIKFINKKQILLDPRGGRKGEVDEKWKIIVNANCSS